MFGKGFRLSGSGLKGLGLTGFRVWGLGFRVWSLGFGKRGLEWRFRRVGLLVRFRLFFLGGGYFGVRAT